MIERLHALVIGIYDTGESSEVVHVLTAEHGPLSVMAKGARRAKSRVAASLQPLAFLELSVSRHEDSDIATLREATVLHSHPELAASVPRLAHASLAAEVAATGCHPHMPARHAVELALLAIDDIAQCDEPRIAARTAMWMLRLLAESGHAPGIDPEVLAFRADASHRPLVFWLDLPRGVVTLEGSQPPEPPLWPLEAARHDAVPIPPEAVRLIHEFHGADDARTNAALDRIDAPRAHQLIEALVRHAERCHDKQLRAARFWRSLPIR